MRKRVDFWNRFIFCTAMMGFASSCVDTTPIYVADSSQYVVPMEAGIDAGESACMRCQRAPDVPGPGCADELAACYTHPSCAKTADCSKAAGCYDLGNSADWTSCSLTCGEKEKLGEDPAALGAAYTNFNCLQRVCAGPCNEGARD